LVQTRFDQLRFGHNAFCQISLFVNNRYTMENFAKQKFQKNNLT
jgi:hypothetical protein